jgi:hypothetical protein
MKNLFGPEYASLDDDAFTPKYKAVIFQKLTKTSTSFVPKKY